MGVHVSGGERVCVMRVLVIETRVAAPVTVLS